MGWHNSFSDFPMFFLAPKIETDQMHIWKQKIFTLKRLIAGWKISNGRLLRTFDATKNFFSVEIIFCVDICVPSSTLEKALFFSFFSDFPMFFLGVENKKRAKWSPLVVSPGTFKAVTERNSGFFLRCEKVRRYRHKKWFRPKKKF